MQEQQREKGGRPVQPVISRRAFVIGVAAGAAALAMPGIALAAGRTLKVSVIGGGDFEGPFEQNIFPAFTQATGIEVESVARPTGGPWLEELARGARAGVAPADVSMLSRATVRKGMKLGLFARLDRASLPTCASVSEEYFDTYPGGGVAGVATVTWHKRDVSGSWVISRVSRARDEAHAFINFMCKPEIQVSLARGRGWSLNGGGQPLPRAVR
jgi:spermidine/putrescine-binding protein